MEFEERAVAFLDIMGFKELIKEAEQRRDVLTKLTSLVTVLESHVRWDNDELSPEVPDVARPKYLFVSDSIVISAPLEHSKYNGLVSVTVKAIQIAHKLLEMGILVRGGITVGKMLHEKANVFGTGFIEAYQTEQNALHPRILLTAKAAKYIQEATLPGMPLRDTGLWLDESGEILVDTLNPQYIRGQNITNRALHAFVNYRAHILNEIEKLHLGSSARGKWKWMAGFLNRSIARHAIDIPPINSFPLPS